ncbi:MAG: hypothetical protein KAS21_04880 [Candidatus Aminicenantes bacterium]|nr:hypothetical protein [Candidatus Aminicenantes bacterium]
MKFSRSELFLIILTFSGFVTFFLNYPFWSPLLFVPFIAFCNSIFSKKRRKLRTVKYFFPFISGLLIFVMNLFFWDLPDFKTRVGNLLLITLFFSIYSIFKKNGIVGKTIGFFNGRGLRTRLVMLFLISQMIFIMASAVIVMKGVELVGDEPHYLAISQSLAKDGDLNVFNQYARDEYREFINYRLTHHSKVGKGFKKWYSFHLPGLSFTLAPFFLLKIPIPLLYFLVRIYLGLFASLLGVVVYMLSLKIWRREKLSLFIFFTFMFTAPVFFYSFHIFAELQVLLLILLSIWFSLFKDNIRRRDILFAGLLLGMTVFWGMKYLIFISLFSLFFFIKKFREKDVRSGLAFAVFPAAFILVFFIYLYFAYGSLSPMSVYTGVLTESQKMEYLEGMQSIKIQNRIETLFDYFFDQRDGLILYSPIYLFFFPGLIFALKNFKRYYPHLIISIASFVYLLYHGYSTVRPGYCPQARYLLPVAWTLMLFAIIYYVESRNKIFKKLFIFIPFYSVFITIFQIFNPFTLYQSTTHNYLDRSGLVFQKLGNIHIDLPSILPSFVKVEGNFSHLPNLIFLFLVFVFIYLSLKEFELKKPGPLPFIVFIILFIVFSLFPRVALYNPVKIKTDAGVSFLVHGNPYPKSDILEEYSLNIKDSFKGTITISTIKKLKQIGLLISGQQDRGEITLSGIDMPSVVIGVKENTDKDFHVTDLHYKKIKGRYFYTLHFSLCYRLFDGLNIKVIPY